MSEETFGQALGKLILQKRRALGLTQVQLSEDAYNTGKKVRRISELENGSVANPHPKTIDPIIVALKISEAEIEACAMQAGSRRDGDLDRAYREARNLIDAVARQFEHAQPDASLAELDDFLRAKAKEWAALRDRIGEIEASDADLIQLKADAALALADGRFDRVDELLAKAEDQYQQERTLAEVRKHADIRITRGYNSLLRGNPEEALGFYQSAADFFKPFDQIEMVNLVQALAGSVYHLSLHSLQPSFFVSAQLLTNIIEIHYVKTNAKLLADISYRLSLIYRNDYQTTRSSAKADLLDKAVAYSRISVAYKAAETETFDTACMKISLANCLMDRAKLLHNAKDISEAISILEKMRSDLRKDMVCQELRDLICNSLGSALLKSRDIDPHVNSLMVRNLALSAFKESLDLSEENSNIERWAAVKGNIAGILAEMANEDGIEESQEYFLRIRAISDYNAAIEASHIDLYPFRFADLHHGLAEVLIEHSKLLNDESSDYCLFRAMQSYEVLKTIYTLDAYPLRWAEAQERIASIFAQHAIMTDVKSVEFDVQKAIEGFEEAAAAFRKANADARAADCAAKIEMLRNHFTPSAGNGRRRG